MTDAARKGVPTAVLVGTYWLMQAIAATIFKYGSMYPNLWWVLFCSGQVFGAGSIVLMMALYKRMNPNVALGYGFGGAFLSAQITMAIVFSSALSVMQWIGMLAMTGGMLLLAFGSAASEVQRESVTPVG